MRYAEAVIWLVAWRKPSSKRWSTFVANTRSSAAYMRRVHQQQGLVCGKAQRRLVLIEIPKESPK